MNKTIVKTQSEPKLTLTKCISLLESYITRTETEQFQHKENSGEWLSLEELKKEIGGTIGEAQQILKKDEESKLVLKEPVKSVKSKSENYSVVLEDGDGTLHFWLKDGTYDGYDKQF